MSRPKQGLALAGVATLVALTCGPLAGTAQATPGGHGSAPGQTKPKDHGQGHGQGHGRGHGQGTAPGQTKPKDHGHGKDTAPGQTKPKDHGHGQDHGQDKDHGKDTAPGQTKPKDHGPGGSTANTGAGHNPPGNNGTVKIAGPGDAVGTPSNDPHPGCTVDVEWFGYDAGPDVVSTVTFTPQAPTSDVTIGGTAPEQVFVGGDDAGGGTDLDGRQAYDLTFSGGAPHPKQGYHVKVTVATPRSLGNDTKTKVFWVEPCDSTPTAEGAAATPSADAMGSGSAAGADATSDRDVAGSFAEGSGSSTSTSSSTGTSTGSSDASGADGTAVPTAVDAGEDNDSLADWARSPLPLALLGGGVVLAGAAVLTRRRSRA